MPKVTRKNTLATVLALLGIASLSAGGYYLWLRTPPSIPEDPEDVVALLQSPRFQRLPAERKAVYGEKVFDLMRQANDQQRHEIRQAMREDQSLRDATREMGMQMMVDRARQFASATPAERDAMLDQTIAMFGQMRGRRGGGDRQQSGERDGQRDSQSGANRSGSQQPDRELTEEEKKEREERRAQRRQDRMDRWQQRLATGNPQHQAMIGEFFSALRERRRQQQQQQSN